MSTGRAAKHRFRAIPDELPLRKDAPDPNAAEVGRLADGRKYTRRDVLRQLVEEQKRDMVTHVVGDVGRAYVDAKTGRRTTARRTTEITIQSHAIEWQDPVGEEAVERADMYREVLRLQAEAEDDQDVA